MKAHQLSVLVVVVAATVLLSSTSALAQSPETFEQGRTLAVELQRPILLEFFRDG
jgi:hypothetical protein